MDDELDYLIPKISIISHRLYGKGIYKNTDGNSFVVDFKEFKNVILSIDDFNKSWKIDNVLGIEFDGDKSLPIDNEYENIFFKKVKQEIAKIKKNIEEEMHAIEINSWFTPTQIAQKKGKMQIKLNEAIAQYNKPYFGRIDISEVKRGNNKMTYYIGEAEHGDFIIDARDNRAEPYHQKDKYDGLVTSIKLDLCRTYTIKGNLIEYTDQLISIQEDIKRVSDDYLKVIIAYNRVEKTKNIIRSIQRKQYDIVNSPFNKNIIVQGCAGSGKTAIMAQRLSFWTFRLKNSFEVSDTYIISPTKILSLEIPEFAKDIGNANFRTYNEFYIDILEMICDYYNVELNVLDHYESNYKVDNKIIKKLYSNISLFKLKGLYQDTNAINKPLYEDACNYLIKIKCKILSEYIKKKIYKRDLKTYYNHYIKLTTLIKKMGLLDVKEYIDLLLSNNSEIINRYNDYKKKKNLNRHEYKAQIAEFKEISKYFEKEQTSNTLNYITAIINNYALLKDKIRDCNKLQQLNIKNVKLKVDEYKQLRNKANIFTRGRYTRLYNRENVIYQTLLTKENELLDNLGLIKDYNDSEVNRILEAIKKEIIPYEKYFKDILTIKNKLEYLNHDLNIIETLITEEEKIYVAELNLKINELKKLIKNKKLLANVAYTKNDINNIIDKIFNKSIKNIEKKISFVIDFQKYEKLKIIKNINSYLENGDFNDVRVLLSDFIIDKYKEKYKIDLKIHYEFELFVKVYLLYDENSTLKIANKWIFIDEFQDYSLVELQFLDKLCYKSYINFFGDLKQSINPKGLTPIGLNSLKRDCLMFELVENYRNAAAITEYVNKECNHTMKSIGLNGKVELTTIDYFISLNFDNQRVALIVKDEKIYKNLLNKYYNNSKVRFFNDETLIEADNIIYVMTPLLSKGLEFDSVCVVNSKLTTNEKYVAYTRAITNLYIV